ncbi:MAG: hypothetical protein ACYDDA_14690 [Acidiferrobacteraceae bacterium]
MNVNDRDVAYILPDQHEESLAEDWRAQKVWLDDLLLAAEQDTDAGWARDAWQANLDAVGAHLSLREAVQYLSAGVCLDAHRHEETKDAMQTLSRHVCSSLAAVFDHTPHA